MIKAGPVYGNNENACHEEKRVNKEVKYSVGF
jgi:hypothetical protein